MDLCVHKCMRVCLCRPVCMYAFTEFMYALCIYVANVYIYICIHVYNYLYVYVYVYVCMYVYMYVD